MYFLTEDLVSSVKNSGLIPTSQITFTDPDTFISFANEEMQTTMVPFMSSVREDYFLQTKYIALQSGISKYPLPERAIGNDLNDLFFVPDTSSPQTRYPLARIRPHDLPATPTGMQRPWSFYLEDSQIVVVGTPTGSSLGSLQCFLYQRPSNLVASTQIAKVTAVSAVGGITTIMVNTDLTAITSPVVVGGLLDVVAGKSPFRTKAIDITVVSISSTQITIATSDAADENGANLISVGDFIGAAQTTNVVLLPQELHPILADCVIAKCLKAMGAMQNYQMVKADLIEKLKAAFQILSNRVESEVDVSYERSGILNSIGTITSGFAFK